MICFETYFLPAQAAASIRLRYPVGSRGRTAAPASNDGMTLRPNIPKLHEICRDLPAVPDVGGELTPFRLATRMPDFMSSESRRTHGALDPEDPERFAEDGLHINVACAGQSPCPDNYFDFLISSYPREDARNSIVISSQLARVSKAGYIELPSWAREIIVISDTLLAAKRAQILQQLRQA